MHEVEIECEYDSDKVDAVEQALADQWLQEGLGRMYREGRKASSLDEPARFWLAIFAWMRTKKPEADFEECDDWDVGYPIGPIDNALHKRFPDATYEQREASIVAFFERLIELSLVGEGTAVHWTEEVDWQMVPYYIGLEAKEAGMQKVPPNSRD